MTFFVHMPFLRKRSDYGQTDGSENSITSRLNEYTPKAMVGSERDRQREGCYYSEVAALLTLILIHGQEVAFNEV